MRFKRTDDSLMYRAYKYYCKPAAPFPQEYCEERRRMIELWNAFCELDEFYSEHRLDFCRQDDAVRRLEAEVASTERDDEREKLDKQLRKQRRHYCKEAKYREPEPGFFKDAIEISKLSQLHWCNREAMLHGFINARQKILSRQGGRPKKKNENSLLSFYIRYTGGGRDIHKLASPRASMFRFENGGFTWKIGGTDVHFKMTYHRPLPEWAIVKTIRLKEARQGFHIVFSCELEPEEPLAHGKEITIFEPRWTSEGETMIIGRLQVGLSSREIKWEDIDLHPVIAAKNVSQRAKKIARLHSAAKKAENGGDPKAKALWEKKRDIEERYIRHRDWCYWNFAKKMAQESCAIILRKLDIKFLGRRKKGVPNSVRRNLRLAAPSDLYYKIQRQAEKHAVPVCFYKNDDEFTQIMADLKQKNGLRKNATRRTVKTV